MKKFADKIFTPTSQALNGEEKWIKSQLEKIGSKTLNRLIKEAVRVRKNAYQPYSGYKVGAALLSSSNKVFSSCNSEAVTYSETDHAEQSVVTQAIANGETKKRRKFIIAIAVCHSGESGPCGACRQRLAEHADNCLILDVSPRGRVKAVTSLKVLLPYAFTPSHLGK